MKDFLENLEIGEGKVKLSKEEIKTILAEHGKTVSTETEKVKTDLNKEIDTYKATVSNLEKQLEEMPSSDEVNNLKKEIQDMKEAESKRIAEEKAMQEDKTLTENIISVFGDKKFTSEYAKNGLIADIKNELSKPENKGKGINDVFELLTKDKEGIFESENKIAEIPGFGTQNPNVTEDDLIDKVMGLK